MFQIHVEQLKVSIIENEPLMMRVLSEVLGRMGCEILWKAADRQSALVKAQSQVPDVAFVDLRLSVDGGFSDGRQLIHDLRGVDPQIGIVIFSGAPAINEVAIEAIRLGYSYIIKEDIWEAEDEILTSAVLAAASGAVVLSREVSRSIDTVINRMEHQDDLSQAELNVLELVAEDMSNNDIAAELIIAVSTVKSHVSNILAKISVKSRTQAANWYKEHYS